MSDSQLKRLMGRGAPATKPETDSEDVFNPADYEPTEYKPFTTTNGKRQPGFAIAMVQDKARYWIFYHSIRRLKMSERNGRDYVQFSHDDLAITIEGQRLAVLLNLIGEGRLKAVFEPNGLPAAASSQMTQPIITAIRVTDIEAAKGDKVLNLVKPA